tara:strand:- start:28501 stop:29112 length:612 start_codon:yes stop_codon:yes gene_type:complete
MNMLAESTMSEMLRLFADGGPVMFMLALIAVILFSTASAAVFFVSKGNLTTKRQEHWVDWIKNPDAGEGRAGEIIRYATHGPRVSIKTVQRRLDEIREVVINSIDRRLIIIGTLVAVAPMTGLLGTVGGMLDMFDGLANASGKKSMEKIQSGMMESLLSPLTGLVIALPGMFMALIIQQKRTWIASALTQLESTIIRVRFKEI